MPLALEPTHPVSVWIKFLNQTAGRDKTCRTLQYIGKLGGYLALNRLGNKELAAKFVAVDKSMSTARQVMRQGKFINQYHTLLRLFDAPTKLENALQTVRAALLLVYFITDSQAWAAKLKLTKGDAPMYGARSGSIWGYQLFVALVLDWMNVRDVFSRLAKAQTALAHANNTPREMGEDFPRRPDLVLEVNALTQRRRTILVSLFKNLADLPQAVINVRRMKNVSAGITGFFGLLSSLLGAYQVWPAQAAPAPAQARKSKLL